MSRLRNSESYLVMNPSQKILAAGSQGLLGWEHLRKAISISDQIFGLKIGDAVIMNDQSCGGLFPWGLTSVLRTEKYILARSHRVKSLWSFSEKADGEGLRIPPMPLVEAGKFQDQILGSLISHPLVGSDFSDRLKDLCTVNSFSLRNQLDRNLQSTDNGGLGRIQQCLHDLPHQEANQEVRMSSGEVLRLKLTCSEEGFSFDFSGTSVGHKCFINESLVLGICREYLSRFFDFDSEAGLLLDPWLHFKSPPQCFLQGKYPQGQLHGLARGIGGLLNVLQRCFQQVFSQEFIPYHNFFPLWIQIKKTGTQSLGSDFDQWILPPGTGAFNKEAGVAGFSMDGLSHVPSLAQIQKYFEINEFSVSTDRAKLQAQRGPGLNLSLVAKHDCELLWLIENSKENLIGDKNHSPLESAQVLVNGEIQTPWGQKKLAPGDLVIFKSGSGSSRPSS